VISDWRTCMCLSTGYTPCRHYPCQPQVVIPIIYLMLSWFHHRSHFLCRQTNTYPYFDQWRRKSAIVAPGSTVSLSYNLVCVDYGTLLPWMRYSISYGIGSTFQTLQCESSISGDMRFNNRDLLRLLCPIYISRKKDLLDTSAKHSNSTMIL